MCKTGISVKYGAGSGRLKDIRLSEKGILVGTFTPNASNYGSKVKVAEVKPTNRKSARKLESELARLSSKKKNSSPGKKGSLR